MIITISAYCFYITCPTVCLCEICTQLCLHCTYTQASHNRCCNMPCLISLNCYFCIIHRLKPSNCAFVTNHNIGTAVIRCYGNFVLINRNLKRTVKSSIVFIIIADTRSTYFCAFIQHFDSRLVIANMYFKVTDTYNIICSCSLQTSCSIVTSIRTTIMQSKFCNDLFPKIIRSTCCNRIFIFPTLSTTKAYFVRMIIAISTYCFHITRPTICLCKVRCKTCTSLLCFCTHFTDT